MSRSCCAELKLKQKGLSTIPSLIFNLPFRLGTTSYIYPADILPNVRQLKDSVDDIELLLFEAHDDSNLPCPDDLEELAEIGDRFNLTYTVHLPLDIFLGDFDPGVRERSVEKTLRVANLMAAINPFSYNVHFEKRTSSLQDIQDIAGWQQHLQRSCSLLLAELEQPEKMCIEYLNYPLELVEDIVEGCGFSYILDLGHMILYGTDYEAYLHKYLHQTRVIHLHGVAMGKDHLSLLSMEEPEHLHKIFAILKEMNYNGVLTLEIFSRAHLEESLQIVERLWEPDRTLSF